MPEVRSIPIFSQDDIDSLYAPFEPGEHEVREGSTKNKVQWFVYVRRQAIQKRLDYLFTGEWSVGFVDPANKYERGKNHVSCAMYLEIRGVRREFNGSIEGLGLNAEKGAATDAFKRVASMWGIGLYLQDTPKIWTDGGYISTDENGKKKTDYKKRDAEAQEALRKATEWLRNGVVQPNEPAPEQPTKRDQIWDSIKGDGIFDNRDEFNIFTTTLIGNNEIDPAADVKALEMEIVKQWKQRSKTKSRNEKIHDLLTDLFPTYDEFDMWLADTTLKISPLSKPKTVANQIREYVTELQQEAS